MFAEGEEESVYKLLTDLCRHFVDANKDDHFFGASHNSDLLVRKLRAKSYEILLKKTSVNVNKKRVVDPVCELLKHAFILRSSGKIFEADELDKCLETLSKQDELNPNSSTFLVLMFFNEIKSLESKTCHDLNVFDIKKYSQDLPALEKYSVESLDCLSKRFEQVLLSQSNNNKNTWYRLPFIVQPTLKYNDVNAIEYMRLEDTNQFMIPASSNIFQIPSSSQLSVKTYQSSNSWDEEFKKHKYLTSKEGIVTEPESPWQNTDTETVCDNWENQTQLNFCDHDQLEEDLWNRIVNVEPKEVSQFRTWESLGILEPEREPNFIAETRDAMIHVTQTKHLHTKNLNRNTTERIQSLKVISTEKLMENLKLLLVGIESDCFCYHNMSFRLVSNIIIPDISREALETFCTELIRMGNCYKSLINLVSQDNKSDIFESEGLIFKALCQSVNEVLSFYQTSIFLLNPRDKGLISFVDTVRPLTLLISDIAVLCDFKNQNANLDGINIFTHIYQQANSITRPNTSLVITSILKSCCEVYFRMLSQWLFEGVCEDVYDEFMIKTRPKYLNVHGHRFWTRAFAINHKSVPGFLSDLADSILECGKTMRLLKICDPKNPVCHLFTKFHPIVKVCFNEKMQTEQMQFFVDYFEKGKEAIGESVSICSAIQQEKDAHKSKREVIDLIHKERFLKRQEARKEDLKKIAEKKNSLLAELKTQAEESARQKIKNRHAEILADKIYLENIMQQEEDERNAEKLKKAETQKYYEDLALESEKCQLRAEWRIKRMTNFDERILLLSAIEKEAQSEFSDFENPVNSVEQMEVDTEVEISEPENGEPENVESEIVDTEMSESSAVLDNKDENDTNINFEKDLTTDDNENQQLSVKFVEPETSFPNRPNVLDLPTEVISNPLILTDNMSEAKRNRLRMLREEFGISPNNNSETDSVYSSDSKIRDEEMNFIEKDFRLKQLAQIESNRTKNMAHRMDEGWATFEQEKKVYGNDLVQQNRTRNMSHQGWNVERQQVTTKCDIFTAAQKNKNRVMMHTVDEWFDTEDIVDNDAALKNVNVDVDTSPQVPLETPMSCTTDYFTHSSNSVPYQSCDETPQFESESDITDGSNENSHPVKKAVLPKFRQHSYGFFQSSLNVQSDSTDSASLTVEDVRMLNSFFLQEHLKKSVLVPLQVQSNLVNSAIIKCFLQDHNLLSHLHSLRSYYFLLNGEFAKSLTNSLYTKLYQVAMPIEMLNSTFLKNTLEKGISCSISNNYMNSELLSLSVTNMPVKLDASNPEVLDCISLNYKVSWPINIIFDEAVMGQYSKVFQFLLMVGRVLWVLQEEFPILKFETKKTYNEQFHKIHLYRFAMMQFMNAVHTYLTCSVLHASWSEFEAHLENAETLDTFYAAHVSYMKKILSRCMLNQRSEMILKSLRQTFSIILKFHSRITSHSWVSDQSGRFHPNFGLLEEMYNSFCQQRAYVVHVAEKFSTSGYQPHLTHFLHALNINNSFKLSVKKNSQF